jgi:hypothetical protein
LRELRRSCEEEPGMAEPPDAIADEELANPYAAATMASVDPSDTGDLEAVETVSNRVFFFVSAVMTFIFVAAELFLLPYVSLRLDLHTKDFMLKLCGLVAANWVLSYIAADRFFKLLGMSRGGSSVETWNRILAKPDGFVALDEVVEFTESPLTNIFGFVFVFLFGLLSLFLAVGSHLAGLHHIQLIFLYGCAIFFGGYALQLFSAIDGCWVRADQRGVFGYPARYSLRRRLLPWSKIATCDIVTRHDPFGTPYLIVPVFKDELGRKLMTLSLYGVPMECQMRLVKYIKSKLPNARVDVEEL